MWDFLTIRFFGGMLGLILLSSEARAQPSPLTTVDSLKQMLRTSRTDITQVPVFLKLSAYYLNKTLNPRLDLDSALTLAHKAEELSRRFALATDLDEALFLRGKIYGKQQKFGTALHLLKSLSDTSLIKLLLELGKNKLRPTYTQNADRESAIAFFRRAETISERIGNQKWKQESQCLIGISYLLNKDWAGGKAYFMKVVKARQQAGDKAGEIRALLRMATTTFCDDCRENMNALISALALSRQIGDQSQEMIILMEMGYEHFQLDKGSTVQAEQKALQVLTIQQSIGFKPLTRAYHALAEESVYKLPGEYGYLSNAYYFMSDLSQARGDLNQKLFYVLKVVKSIETSGLPEELEYAYFKLGNAYYELGLFDESMVYHQKSLAISHQKGRLFIQVGIVSRMVVTMLKQGKSTEALAFLQDITRKNLPATYEEKLLLGQSFGACYSALKQYKLAEKYYLENVTLSKQVASQFRYAAWQRISQFYVANAQYTKADPYLRMLLAESPLKIIPSHQIEVHLMQFKVDSAQGNYPTAIRHYQRYKTLTDSIFNEKKFNQITRLTIQYKTDKKEQALRLREKDIALLTEQSKAQQTQRNALIGGAALLLALLLLSYNRYRLKQQNNQQLKAQQRVLQERQEEINHKNTTLQLLLTEKEWLLREIHHRVKNNLQVVMSLLNAQASYLSDDTALSAIQESQHRVQAMALIHQKLYQDEQIARIGMSSYIQEVVAYLRDAYSLHQPITLQLDVDAIELDLTQAVPLGLIINEAITNALKYAFPKGRPGTISVSLRQIKRGTYQLIIADDGVGLPMGYNPEQSRSLGMTLMHGFSEQLGGVLQISNSSGLTISLLFSNEVFNQSPTKEDKSLCSSSSYQDENA
ncbi:tetratricopeptide repeat-containing sensor histidine kinase [Spirosoma areae]